MGASREPPFSRHALAVAVGSLAGALLFPNPVAAHPVDDEFLVNSTIDDHQQEPDVAMAADGDFVVVFEHHIAGQGNANVSAQRFAADGQPVGDEFLVNSTVNSGSTRPAVAMDDDGDFVVVWQDFGDDGSGYGIYGQRYDAAGQAQGLNFQVNTVTDNAQRRPDVAMDADGDFVVVWEDDQFGDSSRSIKAQRFDALGAALGGEIDVSTDTEADQVFPKVGMDDDGSFVVGWAAGDVGANQDVLFRRFASDGTALGPATQVNVTSRMDHASGVVNNMSVDVDDDGDFVVAWRADNFSGPGVVGASLGVLARRYDADGDPLGDAFEVATEGSLGAPEVAMTGAGEFAVSYSAPDGSLSGAGLQRYYADGQPLGPAFLLNQFTELGQERTAVALADNGDGVVAWMSSNQDGDGDGVYARLLTGSGIGADVDFDTDAVSDIFLRNPDSGRNQLWFMDGFDGVAEAGVRKLAPEWLLAGVADFDRDGVADLLWRDPVSGSVRIWLMDGADRLQSGKVGRRGGQWRIVGVGDFNGDSLNDVLWRRGAGALAVWLMDGASVQASEEVGALGSNWEVAGVDDFDGDGRSDVLQRNAVNGRNRLWLMDGADVESVHVKKVANTDWAVAGTGDLDRDGFADIVWRDMGSGNNRVWLMQGGARLDAARIRFIDRSWSVNAVRDFTGDGRADILFRDSGPGRLLLWEMDGFRRVNNGVIGRPVDGLVPVDVE